MLTYTFSTREKVLLAVLAFVAIGVAWYQLVFSNIQGQIATADAQIASLSNELVIAQAQATSLDSMREVVDAYEAQGIEPILLPSYDNTQNLMAYLNGVLAGTRGYSMSFDTPQLSDDDGSVHRTGNITFGSGSYAEARSVVEAIAHGPYPCEIDALGITDTTQGAAGARAAGSGLSGAVFSSNVQVTFFEKAPADAQVGTDDTSGVQGQDLSVLSDWDQ